MKNQTTTTLKNLAARWKRRARAAFLHAAQEPDPIGRRLIEHGGICYINCADELNARLPQKSGVQPLVSKTQAAKKTSKKGPVL